jgi:hypothetical protein
VQRSLRIEHGSGAHGFDPGFSSVPVSTGIARPPNPSPGELLQNCVENVPVAWQAEAGKAGGKGAKGGVRDLGRQGLSQGGVTAGANVKDFEGSLWNLSSGHKSTLPQVGIRASIL